MWRARAVLSALLLLAPARPCRSQEKHEPGKPEDVRKVVRDAGFDEKMGVTQGLESYVKFGSQGVSDRHAKGDQFDRLDVKKETAAHRAAVRKRRFRITAIKVADPHAGRVDDIQLLRPGRCDAFQVKWSQYPDSLTFNKLVKPEKDKPALICQLADGWQRLSAARPGDHVVVHLLTNDRRSTGDAPPVGDPAPAPRHFAAFTEQVWGPAHRAASGQDAAVPAPWRPAWDAIRVASGLPPGEFDAFVRAACSTPGSTWGPPATCRPGSGRPATATRRSSPSSCSTRPAGRSGSSRSAARTWCAGSAGSGA